MEKEFISYEEAMANRVICDFDKRRKCDSLYIERYNRVLMILHRVLVYAKEHRTMMGEEEINHLIDLITKECN